MLTTLAVSLVVFASPHSRAFVVDGKADMGHSAVGIFRTRTKPCTATLIGKRTVLTAAHAIDAGFAHTFEIDGIAYAVESITIHPGYSVNPRPPSQIDPLDSAENDLAVVILKQAPPVAPAVVNRRRLRRPLVVTIVGFGETKLGADDRGLKRVTTNRVEVLTPQKIGFEGLGSVCHGDSGGPTFAEIDGHEVLVGVHSVVSHPCGDFGVDMRVDAYADWIRESAHGDVQFAPIDGASPAR